MESVHALLLGLNVSPAGQVHVPPWQTRFSAAEQALLHCEQFATSVAGSTQRVPHCRSGAAQVAWQTPAAQTLLPVHA
jgi:hypothetical protein